jgi:hypothetical protein
MQRDSIGFEKRDHFPLVEIAGEREHGGTGAANVGDHFARVIDAAEVGEIAGQNHEIAISHHLAHPVEIASRHVNVAKGDYFHESTLL